MKTKSLRMFSLGIFALFVFMFVLSAVSADTLSQWPLTLDGNATSVDSNVSVGTFSSSGVTFNSFDATNGAEAEDWSTTSSADSSKYYEVTIAPKTDFDLIITDINFEYGGSATGPASFDLQYSKQSSFASPTTLTTKTDVSSSGFKSSSDSSLSIFVASGETLTLRLFGYNFSVSTNEFFIRNLLIQGTTSSDPPEVTSCTSVGNPGRLRVKRIDFTNEGMQHRTFGSDDEWFPFEEVEVELQVKNDGDEDVDDVEISWGLWDTQAQEWVIDFDEEDTVNIRDGDTETLTFTFEIDDRMDIDLEDLNDGDHYRFYVTAEGEVDNSTSPDTCASDFEQVSIILERDFVVLDNIEMPDIVQCGETVEVTAEVWNVGDRDQDEVSIEVYGRESVLGIIGTFEVGDINEFDNQRISFLFTVPRNIDEKFYALKFEVKDDDDDVYENDFDDDLSEFVVSFKVEGGCVDSAQQVTVSASLVSGGKAGEDLVIQATVTNTGTDLETYTLSSSGHESWASSYTVEPSIMALGAGQSGETVFTFTVNQGASGEQSFFIEILPQGETEAIRQEVSVDIESSGFFGITGLALGGNTGLLALGLLNVIIVVVIIVVAVKIARRK